MPAAQPTNTNGQSPEDTLAPGQLTAPSECAAQYSVRLGRSARLHRALVLLFPHRGRGLSCTVGLREVAMLK